MPKPTAKVDWAAVLRSGPGGVKKWNRLTAVERWQVKLRRADLSGCDLAGIKLGVLDAEQASFVGTTLTGARLEGCFADCNFADANLTGAKLEGATFPDADFARARLAGVNLRTAALRRARFDGTDLTGADLRAADLCAADLSGANLTDARLDNATFDARTKWPAGFALPGELKWTGRGTDPRLSGKGKKAIATDFSGLMARLNALIDPKRMKRTLDMLKAGKNQLFSEVEPSLVRGIVRSQTQEDLVYSCVLTAEGVYACCTADLSVCMGLSGEPCKHLLVLLIGLARAGQLDPTTIDRWVMAAAGQNPKWNKTTRNHVSDALLKYQGVQAGEIDWRPTETIPEDFYAM
jgi:hypothetical protein